MELSNLLIIVFLAVVLLYLYSKNSKSEPIHNEGMLTQDSTIINTESDSSSYIDSKQEDSVDQESISDSTNGEYKRSNYSEGNRNAESSALDKFFEGNHTQEASTGFSPMDNTDGRYASYLSEKNGSSKLSDKDKFNTSSLLPKEKNGDWFDDPYESTSIKSSHLINIYRPVGVNTIQTTLKNPSHDIRGTPPNPKYPVSPWSNSSYEPDTNLHNQTLC